jgi:eukaryotic-like serine/threonine-protein kinase
MLGAAGISSRLMLLTSIMPAPRSIFRNSALLSGLVTADQLEQAVLTAGVAEIDVPQAVAATIAQVDDGRIATRLVEMGILTPYQATQIRAGRTKFSLGPYVVTDFIGQGGMGQVFKGVHQMMGRECAIKVLPLNKATPDAVTNFTREIRTQAQLDHPNLVRAEFAGREGNTHYLVVEYVPGVDLRRLVRTQGPLSQQQAASVMLQAARGLDYAHKRGLVHRDVKPGNILVTSQGIAKVSDLGLAGFMYDAEHDPRAGKIVGTADYLAPEQIRSPSEVSHRVDIYSLGCTLYYCVCGKVPFPGGTARDKARRHCEDTPWHPRRFNAELNEEFVEVIADMMEKDPKARIQSAAEIVARLELWAGEAAPITPRTSIRSPWSAPPLPSGPDDEKEILQDTDGSEHSASGGDGSGSQMSQGTSPNASSETAGLKSRSRAIPILQPVLSHTLTPNEIIARTLILSIPLSMVAGALIAALAFWFWR